MLDGFTLRRAAIKLDFYVAAAGPALQRSAAELRASYDDLCDAIRSLEAHLVHAGVPGFRVDEMCRWNGERFMDFSDGARPLIRAPRLRRLEAMENLDPVAISAHLDSERAVC